MGTCDLMAKDITLANAIYNLNKVVSDLNYLGNYDDCDTLLDIIEKLQNERNQIDVLKMHGAERV